MGWPWGWKLCKTGLMRYKSCELGTYSRVAFTILVAWLSLWFGVESWSKGSMDLAPFPLSMCGLLSSTSECFVSLPVVTCTGPCVCHCGTYLGLILGITHLKSEATNHFPHECLVASCFPVCLPWILFSSCSFIYVKTSYVFRTMRVHRATYKRITWPSLRLQGAYSFPGRIRYLHETIRTVKM